MAKINLSSFNPKQDGNKVFEVDWKQQQEIIVTAVNATDDEVKGNKQAQDGIAARMTTAENAIDSLETRATNVETNKTDKTGDHQGTWHGLLPSQANESIASQVQANTEKLGISLKKNQNDAYPLGEKSFLQEVDGDLWITANCYYDKSTSKWMRVDESKISFGLQIQGTGSIAFETVQGFNVWKASPGTNPIGEVATIGGWEIAMLFTGHSNTVIGGMNFEIDGSGASPEFGRINQLADGTYFSRNCYWDGVRFVHDKVTQPAIAIRIDNRTGKFELLRAPKGSDEDIPYNGSGSNQPDVVWGEAIPIWHDESTDERSAVRVFQTASQFFVADSWNAITMNGSEEYDNLLEYDNTTGIFTAKKKGIYVVTCSVTVNVSTTGRFVLTLSKQGAEHSRFADMQVQAGQVLLNGSCTVKLNEGEYFSIFSYTQNDISTVAGSSLTHMSVTKIA